MISCSRCSISRHRFQEFDLPVWILWLIRTFFFVSIRNFLHGVHIRVVFLSFSLILRHTISKTGSRCFAYQKRENDPSFILYRNFIAIVICFSWKILTVNFEAFCQLRPYSIILRIKRRGFQFLRIIFYKFYPLWMFLHLLCMFSIEVPFYPCISVTQLHNLYVCSEVVYIETENISVITICDDYSTTFNLISSISAVK